MFTKAPGRTISTMVKVLSSSKTNQPLLALLFKVTLKVMEFISSQMDRRTQETSKMAATTAMGSCSKKTVNHMLVTGPKEKSMAMVFSDGKTANRMKEALLTTKRRVKELLNGLMEEFTRVLGIMIFSTVKVCLPARPVRRSKENGKTVNVSDG